MSPRILPSGKIMSARTLRSAAAASEDRLADRRTPSLRRQVDRLPPAVADEFWEADAMAHNISRSDTSRLMAADALVQGCSAARRQGERITTVHDFAKRAVIDAICRDYDTRGLSRQSVSSVLRRVRTTMISLGGRSSRAMRDEITSGSKAERRGDRDHLPTEAECHAAALAAYAEAVLLAVRRPRRARTRMRDAVMLAAQNCLRLRRGEFKSIVVEILVVDDRAATIEVVVAASDSKVRKVQLGTIADPAVIGILKKHVGDRRDGSLFTTNWGAPLSYRSHGRGLGRASVRGQGVHLSFTKVRQIGVTNLTDLSEMQAVTRHEPGSRVTEEHYARHADGVGLQEVRRLIKRAR